MLDQHDRERLDSVIGQVNVLTEQLAALRPSPGTATVAAGTAVDDRCDRLDAVVLALEQRVHEIESDGAFELLDRRIAQLERDRDVVAQHAHEPHGHAEYALREHDHGTIAAHTEEALRLAQAVDRRQDIETVRRTTDTAGFRDELARQAGLLNGHINAAPHLEAEHPHPEVTASLTELAVLVEEIAQRVAALEGSCATIQRGLATFTERENARLMKLIADIEALTAELDGQYAAREHSHEIAIDDGQVSTRHVHTWKRDGWNGPYAIYRCDVPGCGAKQSVEV